MHLVQPRGELGRRVVADGPLVEGHGVLEDLAAEPDGHRLAGERRVVEALDHPGDCIAGRPVLGVGALALFAGLLRLLLGPRDLGPEPSVVDERSGDKPDQAEHTERGRDGPPGPSSGPFRQPLGRGDRPGVDRLAVEVTSEILGERAGRAVAPRRGFLKALQRDRLEVPRDRAGEPPRRGRLGLAHQLEHDEHRLARERRPAGEHLVEDGPQRVDIGRRSDPRRVALGLLGRHVVGRSEDGARLRPRAVAVALRQPEVADLGRAEVGREQDVRRLEVAVDDPRLVGVLHGERERRDGPRHVVRRHRTGREAVGKRAPLDELHRQIRHAVDPPDVVDRHDVRMPEPRRRLRLAAEPRGALAADQRRGADLLQRDQPAQGELPRPVDDAHPALADDFEELISRPGILGNLGPALVGQRGVSVRRADQGGERVFLHRPDDGPARVARRDVVGDRRRLVLVEPAQPERGEHRARGMNRRAVSIVGDGVHLWQ